MGWPSTAKMTSSGSMPVVAAGPCGLNTFILSNGGGNQGLGFAIPAPVVDFVYRSLRKYGHVEHVEIGVLAQTITPRWLRAWAWRRTGACSSSTSYHGTGYVHQRTSAVAGVNGRVSLQVHYRVIVIGLPPGRTYDAHCHGALQSFRAANGKDKFSALRNTLQVEGQEPGSPSKVGDARGRSTPILCAPATT